MLILYRIAIINPFHVPPVSFSCARVNQWLSMSSGIPFSKSITGGSKDYLVSYYLSGSNTESHSKALI